MTRTTQAVWMLQCECGCAKFYLRADHKGSCVRCGALYALPELKEYGEKVMPNDCKQVVQSDTNGEN